MYVESSHPASLFQEGAQIWWSEVYFLMSYHLPASPLVFNNNNKNNNHHPPVYSLTPSQGSKFKNPEETQRQTWNMLLLAKARETNRLHFCHLLYCHLMPSQPTHTSVCTRKVRSCQGTGMLKCEPVESGWVNCGKNLPTDVPYMAVHDAGREDTWSWQGRGEREVLTRAMKTRL